MFAVNSYLRPIVVLAVLSFAVLAAATVLRFGVAETELTVMIQPAGYEADNDQIVVDITEQEATAYEVIQQIAGAPDNAVIAFVVPEADFEPVTLGTVTVDYTNSFLAVHGETSLFGTTVSALLALDWEDEDSTDGPEWALAASVDALSLSALNSAWTLPGGLDPNLSDGFIAVASSGIEFPEELAAEAITGFFPDGFSTDEDATVQTGVTLLGTMLVAGVIGDNASQVLFGNTTQTVTLRGQFSAPLSLFNLSGEPDAEDSPIPTQVSLSAQLPIEDAVGFPGYVSAVGDWELSLDIESSDETEFEVSGSGSVQVADAVAPPSGVGFDLEFSVSYTPASTTVEISAATTAQITNLFGTGITIDEAGFSATIVSGDSPSADFELNGTISVGEAGATVSIAIATADGELQTAELSFELSEVNAGDLVEWSAQQLGAGSLDIPDFLSDIELTAASLTVNFDFTDGEKVEFEVSATMTIADAEVTGSLSFTVEDGQPQTAELSFELSAVNVGNLVELVAGSAVTVPDILVDIELTEASLTVAIDFTEDVVEVDTSATMAFADLEVTGSLSFRTEGGQPQEAELSFALSTVNIGSIVDWATGSAVDLPDIVGDVELTDASVTVTIDFTEDTVEFDASAALEFAGLTTTGSLSFAVEAGQVQEAELSFELSTVNLGELVEWASGDAVELPDLLADIGLTEASLTLTIDFTEDVVEFDASATVTFAGIAATGSLSFTIEGGQLQTLEVSFGIGDVNIGELVELVADGMGLDVDAIPPELDGITLTEVSLTITADFTDGVTAEVEARAGLEVGSITATGSLSFTIADGTLDSAQLLLELGNLHLEDVLGFLASQVGLENLVNDIPDELIDFELRNASLRVGLNFGSGASVEVAAFATIRYDGFARPVDANLLLHAKSSGGTPDLTMGLGIDTSLTLNDIIEIAGIDSDLGDFGTIPLPDFAIGFSTAGIAWDTDEMPPEVYNFFANMYNCDPDGDPDPCEGTHSRNDVPDGAFLIAAMSIPEALLEPLEGLSGGVLSFNDPIVLKGTIGGLFGGGAPSIGLELLLPRLQPEAPVGEVIDSVELRVALSADAGLNVTATLEGTLTLWLPTVLEPGYSPDSDWVEDDFQRTTFLIAVDLGLSLSGIEIVLTGAVMPGDGEDHAWASPFGQEWLTIGGLVIQVGVGVSSGGTIDISFGMGGAVGIDLGSGMKDFRAAFDMAVQIRPIAPSPFVAVTPKPNGFYLASDAGIDIADVIHLYNLFAADLPAAMELDDFPDIAIPSGWEDFNVGIKDMELSFALETNARLCLFQGLRIKADLYIGGPAGYVPDNVADCVFGSADNQPREVLPGGSCSFGDNEANGCFAGLDISVSPTGLEAQANMGAVDLGPVKLSDTELGLFFSTNQQFLKLKGGVVVEGLAEGNVEVFIEPTGFAFLADMNLLEALFQARIQGEGGLGAGGGLDLTNPTFSIQGEMQTAFGHEAVAVWRPIAQPIVVTLIVVHKFMTIMADPNLTISEMTTALLDMPDELEDVGYRGPAIDAARDISSEVRSIIRAVDRAEFSISFDEVFEHMLGGASIGFDGVKGKDDNLCVLWNFWGSCVERIYVCFGIETQGGCWLIPPFNITIPNICDVVGIPGDGACDLDRIRAWFQPMMEDAFREITGLDFDDILGALDHAISQFNQRPVVFSLECAAFNFDLGGGEHAPGEDEFALRLWFVLMGFDIYLSLDWNFNDRVVTNLNRLRDDLLGAIFTGETGDDFSCDLGSAIGVPEPDEQPPSNLQITSISPDPVKEGRELTIHGTFSPGSAIASDKVNVAITWPDDEQTELVDIGGNAASFTASKVIEDDLPSGQPSSTNDIIVVVKNESLGQTSTIVPVTVQNVPPVIHADSIEITRDGVSVTEVDEGDEITISGAFSDVGVRDSHRVYVDWGDGNTDSLSVDSDEDREFSFDHAYLDGFYENGDSSVYEITIRVVDKDTGEDVHVEPLVVHNVDPVLLDESIRFYRVDLDEGQVIGREPIGTEGGLPVIEEGAGIEVYGQFTDPGLIDTHTVHVDWGDTNPSAFNREIGVWPGSDLEQPGLREFRVVYTYLDDDPIKGDPFGDLTVTIQVEDKDGDVSNAVTRTVRVRNVDPEVSLSLEQETILENETAVLTIDIVDPGILDTFEVEVDWGDGSEIETFSVDSQRSLSTGDNQDEVPDGVTTDLVDGRLVISVVRTHQYLDDDPTGTPQDDYIISVEVEDDDTGFGSDDIVITVVNTDPRRNYVSHPDKDNASVVQYSDPLDDEDASPNAAPIVVVLDNVEADTMWAETRWEFFDIFESANLEPGRLPEGEVTDNGSIVAEGLPEGLFMVPPPGREDGEIGVDDLEHCVLMTEGELAAADLPGPRIACTWTVDGRAMTAPGHYIITFTVTDDDTGVTEVEAHLVVYPEDAEANYVGPTVVSAPSLNDGDVDLELRTVLRDISDFTDADEHPLWDPHEGDIAKAVVTFFDDATGEELCGTRDIGYVFDGNERVGVASCVADIRLAPGDNERELDLRVVVSGWYTNGNEGSQVDNTLVTISVPRGDFVVGNGQFDLVDTGAGAHPPGLSTQMLTNVRWGNPGNSSLTGQSWVRFTSGGQSFEIDVVSFETLGTEPGATRQEGHAQVEATAVLRDRSGGGRGAVVAEDLRLQLRITDIRNTADLAFALWDDSISPGDGGRLLAASNWDDDHVPELPLGQGNIQVQVR